MSNEFLDFIEDILDAMDNAEMFLHNISYDQFKDIPHIKPQIQQILADYEGNE